MTDFRFNCYEKNVFMVSELPWGSKDSDLYEGKVGSWHWALNWRLLPNHVAWGPILCPAAHG
jgi:hypothetical protein